MAELKAGWQRVKFGEVVRLNKETCKDPAAAGIERVIGLEHLEPGDLRVRSWADVSDGTTFTNRVRPGQVLFGKRRAYQRKVALADFDAVCSGDIYVLESTDQERLLPGLLPFICQTDAFCEHAVGTSAGSLSPRTNWKSLSEFRFTLPPPEEQRRIAATLNAIATVVDSRKSLAAASAGLLESLIIRDETNLQRIRLGDIYSITGGYAFKSADYVERGAPLMRIGNIENGKATLNETTKYLPLAFLDDYAEYRVDKGDLLVGLSGATTGKSGVYILDSPSLLNQRVARLRILPGFESEDAFFRYSLSLAESTILKIAGGSAQPNISTGSLAAVEINLPGQRKRKAISEIVHRLEESGLHCAAKSRLLTHMTQKLLAS